MKIAAPRTVRVASLVVVVVGLTSLSGCSTNDTDTQRTAQGMVATAEVLDRFDGYLSVGLRVENTSDEPLLFEADDDLVIGGAGGPDWSLPFGPRPESGVVDGYALEADWPPELSPGAVATTAFLMDENSDEAVLTVTSINGGSVTFSTR